MPLLDAATVRALALALNESSDWRRNSMAFLDVLMATAEVAAAALWLRARLLQPSPDDPDAYILHTNLTGQSSLQPILASTHATLRHIWQKEVLDAPLTDARIEALGLLSQVELTSAFVYRLGNAGVLALMPLASLDQANSFVDELKTLMAAYGRMLEQGTTLEHLRAAHAVLEQKQADAIHQAQFLGRLFDALPSRVAVFDANSRLCYANPLLTAKAGQWRELIGRTILDIAKDLEWSVRRGREHEAALQRAYRQRKPIHFDETLILPSGEVRYIEHKLVPLLDDHGAITFVLMVGNDVTERRHVERALRANEEKYSNLFHQSIDAILLHDLSGRITDANAQALHAFGYDLVELLMMRIDAMYAADDTNIDIREAYSALREGQSTRFEVMCEQRDGSVFPAEVVARLVSSGGRLLIQSIIRDLTVHRNAEQQLQQAHDLTLHSNQVKEQFIANISHEMRTPLNVVQGMTHLLRQDAETPEQRRQLDAIHAAADDLLQLINQVLSHAELEADDLVYLAEPFELRRIYEYLARRFRRIAEAKGLRLIVDVDADVPSHLIGDADRINQVLHQLLSNAVKFTQEGSIQMAIEVAAAGRVRFSVSDTGVGIPLDQQETVFDRFIQADGADSRPYGGAGLGLSLVRTLVTGMGGTVELVSTQGKGSKFSVQLPLAAATRASRMWASVEARSVKRRILVVEDNLLNQEVVRRMLQQWGMQVHTAATGEEALAFLADHTVDLVLLDLQMPGMDGYMTARQIRATIEASAEVLPVLAVSASALERRRKKLAEAGMNGYLTKPFGPDDLWACIQPWLNLTVADKRSEKTISEDDYQHIDMSHMRMNAFGSNAFLKKVLDICLHQVPDFAKRLRAAKQDKRWEDVAFIAHKMKSTTGTVGAVALTKRLRALESLLQRTPNAPELPLRIDEILQDAAAVVVELKQERQRYT